MPSVFPEINASVMKRLKFMLSGIAVFFAVLLPGALWYKGAQRSVASAAAGEATFGLQQRLNLIAQSLGAGVDLAGPWLWRNTGRPGHKGQVSQLRRDLPYDIATVFTHQREFYDGFRKLSDGRGVVDLSAAASRLLFAADSGLMDRVSVGRSLAGLLTVEDKLLLVSLHRLKLSNTDAMSGFLIVGKWLTAEHFRGLGLAAPSDGIEFYSLVNDETIPANIKGLIPAAQRNGGFLYELDGTGRGVLYSVLQDVNGRPALISALPWQAPWRATGTLGFGIFFSAAAITGLGAWALLVWGDSRSRRRVRKFDGLSSLSADQIKVLVESFPGYAFALKPNTEYVAVSRVLAGVTGHEPSYFCGQNFGLVASETSDESYERLFSDLRDSKRWPRVAEVNHRVEGLGASFDFIGSAHFLAKQDILLVILSRDVRSMARGDRGSMNSPKIVLESTVA